MDRDSDRVVHSKLVVGLVVDNEFDNDPRVNRMVSILLDEGYSVSVLCYGYMGRQYQERDKIVVRRITVLRRLIDILFFFENLIPLFDLFWSYHIRKFILSDRIDVLHVNDLYLSRPAHMAVAQMRVKPVFILDLHENFPVAVLSYNWTKGFPRKHLSLPGRWSSKEERYLSYPDYIITLSEYYADQLSGKFNFTEEKRIVVLPNYPDLDELEGDGQDQPEVQVSKKDFLFLYFGAVGERRGIFTLIDAVSDLNIEGVSCQLLIIGPVDKADQKRFSDCINRKGMRDLIVHIPWTDVSRLPYYLGISDAGVAPFVVNEQHDSGIANKLFQYMYGGLPVIVSSCAAQKEMVEKYSSGYVYDSYNELKLVMKKLIEEREAGMEMGARGREAVIKNLNMTSGSLQVKSLYRDIASRLTSADGSKQG
ncbi:MAG: glycosyltransferase [Bacteroidales bacterium]|nr:glycosyltransferase [Bacteroidales bacterium]